MLWRIGEATKPVRRRPRSIEGHHGADPEFQGYRAGAGDKRRLFSAGIVSGGGELLLEGEISTGRSILRDYINATIGFESLAEATQTPPKSLMRMFGPKGNPTVVNLFAVIHALQNRTGVHLEVRAVTETA